AQPPKARPPQIDAGEARALWAEAPDGWSRVQPAKRSPLRAPAAKARLWGEVGVSVDALTGATTKGRAVLEAHARYKREAWRAEIDARAMEDYAQGATAYRFEARRLWLGQARDGWGWSGGRLGGEGRLQEDALDGARLRYGALSVSGGLIPTPEETRPDLEARAVGFSTARRWSAGDFTADAQLDGLLTNHAGASDRVALAPTLQLYSPRFTAFASAEVDRGQGADPMVLSASELYLSGRLLSRLRLGGRLYTRRGLDLARTRAIGLPWLEGERRTMAVDLGLDGGAWGLWSASLTLGQEGTQDTLTPALDLWLPIAAPLSLRGGFSLTDAAQTRVNQGRAALTLRPITAWPLELDLGGRAARVEIKDRPALTQDEWAASAALFTQAGRLRLHLYGERLQTHTDIYSLMARLSWSFDDPL
ncbi:hypothetical protein KKB55_08715, partial [Myxococcota bacterium]|nr:hypothetical protein [Myxococcota bacterium]